MCFYFCFFAANPLRNLKTRSFLSTLPTPFERGARGSTESGNPRCLEGLGIQIGINRHSKSSGPARIGGSRGCCGAPVPGGRSLSLGLKARVSSLASPLFCPSVIVTKGRFFRVFRSFAALLLVVPFWGSKAQGWRREDEEKGGAPYPTMGGAPPRKPRGSLGKQGLILGATSVNLLHPTSQRSVSSPLFLSPFGFW